MDSRGPPRGPPQPTHHHHHHQPPPQQPRMMMHHQHHNHHHHHTPPPNSSPYSHHQQHGTTNSNPTMITQNSSPLLQNNTNNSHSSNNNRFPFNSSTQTNPSKLSMEQLHSSGYPADGLGDPNGPGSGPGPGGFGIDPQKKKRGRPRKYSPDGGGGGSNIALGLSPTPLSPPIGGPGAGSGGGNNGGGGGQGDSSGTVHSSEHKKHRGRPPSSGKKQLDALGNCGVGFTPHVILVNAGEDIASKIMDFSKEGPRTVCILSANGSICNVSLRQPAMSGAVNYEGRFDIISLSGSFLFSEDNGGQVRTGGLSVSLAGTDGRVLGGGVAGILVAASPVQIIVGSFIADGKKPKYMPSIPNSHMLTFSAPSTAPTAESPVSQEASSEGSEEDNQGNNHINMNTGSYANSNHPIHNMQMYSSMGWPNSG